MTTEEACHLLLSAIAEGWAGQYREGNDQYNLFGRPAITTQHEDLSFVSGLSSTGLRAGAILKGSAIEDNIGAFNQVVRYHLPLVVIAVYDDQQMVHALNGKGAFQWWPATPQEVVDRILMAFRTAELTLTPGVIAVKQSVFHDKTELALPNRQQLIRLLGQPDDQIKTQTPAQELIFGKARRRVPHWMNMDHALALGLKKDKNEIHREVAAKTVFFRESLPPVIRNVQEAYNLLTDNNYSFYTGDVTRKTNYAFLSCGLNEDWIRTLRNDWSRAERKRVAWFNLHLVNPFPEELLRKLKEMKGLAILEQSGGREEDGGFLRSIQSVIEGSPGTVRSARYANLPSGSAVKDVLNTLLSGSPQPTTIWMDTKFNLDRSKYPKHQILNQAIKRNYPELGKRTAGKTETDNTDSNHKRIIPYTARQYKDKGAPITRLSRFYDDTALLYAESPEELLADPFQAIPTAPPATANFAPLSQLRETFPVYKPENCTACGECFVHCPHSAIPPLVLGVDQLIQTGVQMTSRSSHQVTALMPMLKQLSKAVYQEIRKRESTDTLKPLLESAFDEMTSNMKIDDEKLDTARKDLRALIAQIGDLPVAKTEVMFGERDAIEAGSGELFTLAIDPSACTACGLCVEVCPEQALEMGVQNEETTERAVRAMERWEQLPDTASDTIIRLVDNKEYNSLAAVLLSHGFYSTLVGGNMREGELPSKCLVHMLGALTEVTVQSRYSQVASELEELISSMTTNVHRTLNEALPEGNLDALAGVLSRNKNERIPFDEVIEQWGAEQHMALIDRSEMERKVRLIRDVKNLKWALLEGPSGTGRSHYSLAMDPNLDWAGNYPWNPFTVPVVFWEGRPSNFVRAMISGQIRHLLDNIRIWRRAKLEANDQYDPKVHDREIAELTYDDLTDDERAFIPPLLLVCKRTSLEGRWEEIHALLDTTWPVKILLLDGGVPSTETAQRFIHSSIGQILPAMMNADRFLLKSSLADPNHLFAGIQEGMDSRYPALFWVLSPDPEAHCSNPNRWPALSSMANSTRAFPHFYFSPSRGGQFISSGISIEENPDPGKDWHTITLSRDEEETKSDITYALTWADWAYNTKTWESYFQVFEQEMGEPLPLAEYLTLDRKDREEMIPVIYRVVGEEFKRYSVGPEVVEITESCRRAWNALREWSGTLTAFPEKLRKRVERDLSDQFQQELEDVKKEYERKIEQMEVEHLERVRLRLKKKLMQMAGHKNGSNEKDNEE